MFLRIFKIFIYKYKNKDVINFSNFFHNFKLFSLFHNSNKKINIKRRRPNHEPRREERTNTCYFKFQTSHKH